MNNVPCLYGLENTNRKDKDLWGKNQFNSAFPVSLACYMWDNNIFPITIKVDGNLSFIQDTAIGFIDVFGASRDCIQFDFEDSFKPFSKFLYDDIDRIDLIVRKIINQRQKEYVRPLEIKLTVLPDSTTYRNNKENTWGCELVIRPVSSSYAILTMFSNVGENKEARAIVESTASTIADWNNVSEILNKSKSIIDCMQSYICKFYKYQQAFLIQPIWKTKGQSPDLSDNCFDIFVWTDFMLCKVIVDSAENSLIAGKDKVTRSIRECARMLRCLYELHTRGKVNIRQIYRSMDFGHQTDKAVAFSGKYMHRYMKSERLAQPLIKKDVLKHIILNGGENELNPERRFDASIYFAYKGIMEK
ncbi:MAG: HindVP family restriction endonuclease [Elusimicrobiota bacterium]|jgi:hypothetical protein|nr:HindVP family restriction endonuclease [Elusimicrobiota bacterium]